tara:strand:+ start:717 stop:1328 length:612 start_codon:yes stop_codon:yes gene_type:complete
MTTYILAGGYMSKAPDGGKSFYQSIVGGLNGAVVLLCPFAEEEANWEKACKSYEEKLASANPGVLFTFLRAKPERMVEQIADAHVIIYLGGQSDRLMETLCKIDGWLEADLADKTVVGTSAGAYMLSTDYVKTSDKPEMLHGTSHVACAVVAHYRKPKVIWGVEDPRTDYWNAVDDMLDRSEKSSWPVYRLHEGTFVIHRHHN